MDKLGPGMCVDLFWDSTNSAYVENLTLCNQ